MVKRSFRQGLTPVHQVENLNTRLEKAKQIAKKRKIFPVYNKDEHFVVRTDDGKGFYIVNAEGCCNRDHQQVDLLQGYCEHRLAVELFKEDQERGTASWVISMAEQASSEPEEEPQRHLGHQASGRRTAWTS